MSYISWCPERSVQSQLRQEHKKHRPCVRQGLPHEGSGAYRPSEQLKEARPGDCRSLWGAPAPRARQSLSAGNSCSSPGPGWLHHKGNGRATGAPPETHIWEACATPSIAAKERRKMTLASLPATFQGLPEFICNYDGVWKCIQNSTGSGVREREFSGSRTLQCKEEREGCSQIDVIRQIQQKRRGTFLQYPNLLFKDAKDC